MAPHFQSALQVQEIGKPLQLATQRPIPTPRDNQVLVRVKVVGLNPHDQKSRDAGLFIANNLPSVIGNDVVGVITGLGSGVTASKKGDRVVGQANWGEGGIQMGLQEYAVLDVDHIARIPVEISDDEAATIPTNLLAPLIALFEPSKLGFVPPWAEAKPDYSETILLIIGGGSNCGRFAVQLACLAGIGKIVVVGGDEKELMGYGATKVLSRHGSADEVLERIRDVVGDDLLRVFDAVSPAASQSLAINALSSVKKGRYARLLRRGDVDVENVKPKEQGYETLDIFGSTHAFPEVGRPFWKNLPGYLATGKVRPTSFVVTEGLDVEAVNELLDAYRDGRKAVKTHFHVS